MLYTKSIYSAGPKYMILSYHHYLRQIKIIFYFTNTDYLSFQMFYLSIHQMPHFPTLFQQIKKKKYNLNISL